MKAFINFGVDVIVMSNRYYVPIINGTKHCAKCNQMLPVDQFYKSKTLKSGYTSSCKKCDYKYSLRYRKRKSKRELDRSHRIGLHKPMHENKYCSAFLGVHIAENILSRYFNNIKKMPHNNKGYDFVCEKGYKIDVKSSSTRRDGCYAFDIEYNKTADFFLCLAFDNRNDLNPIRVWLIPGIVVNSFVGIRIGLKYGKKYNQYEKPIDKVIDACNLMKAAGKV